MYKQLYPILEFDGERQSILEPTELMQEMDVPEHCVILFFC